MTRLFRQASKYGNRRSWSPVCNRTFDSLAERKWGEDLRLLEQAGEISDVRYQVRFPLVVGDIKICTYVADFCWTEKNGTRVTADAKGFVTKEYRLKAKLMQALYGVTIRELEV